MDVYIPHWKHVVLGGLALTFSVSVGMVIVRQASVQEVITPKPDEGYRIVRTERGFSPEKIVIPLGELVTFLSLTPDEFWPASNIHPTHDIYPAFDPARPLKGEEWSFRFDTPGRWHFHDHLFASAGGTIVVVDPTQTSQVAPKRLHDCEEVPREIKVSCWDELFAYTLKDGGLEAAFDLFVKLYRTEPDVPKGCHGWGHILGEAAYRDYREGKGVDLRPETTYCGYGFYHGFLENLVSDTGDPRSAYGFCQTLQSGKDSKLKYNNCIHGIGHGGAASIVESPAMYGKYQESVDAGEKLCRSFTAIPQELRDCFDGVFNELVLDMWNSSYGLSREKLLSPSKPLAFCRSQNADLRASCYFEYMGVFEHLFDGDFFRAASYVADELPDDSLAAIAIHKLAGDFMQNDIVNESYAENVRVCRSLRAPLQGTCIGGISNGLIAHGEPEREYLKVIPFCASALLTEEEQATCFRSVMGHFRAIYTKKLMKKVCDLTPPLHQGKYCSEAT